MRLDEAYDSGVIHTLKPIVALCMNLRVTFSAMLPTRSKRFRALFATTRNRKHDLTGSAAWPKDPQKWRGTARLRNLLASTAVTT